MKNENNTINKISDLKSVSVDIREWFDSRNGNSYFSGRVTLNPGMSSEETINLPFEYGYGSHSEYVSMDAIKERFPRVKFDSRPLWQLRDRGIPYSYTMTPCTQRECRGV